MTSTILKLIALISMIIDHISIIFFPEFDVLRDIGRISFPIFAFFIVQGFLHTRSIGKYYFRIALIAVVSEIPYNLCFFGTLYHKDHQSVMLELLLGLTALIFLKLTRSNPIFILGIIISGILSLILYADYGLYGIVLMLSFYILKGFRGADTLSLIAITYLFYGTINFGFDFANQHYNILTLNQPQLLAGFAVVPLVFYNGAKGKQEFKALFYIIYPIHLLIIYFIKYHLIPYIL